MIPLRNTLAVKICDRNTPANNLKENTIIYEHLAQLLIASSL